MTNQPQDLISAATVAELLGKDQRTVQRWAANGTLPVVSKLDGAKGPYIFDRSAIEAFKAEGSKTTPSSDDAATPLAAEGRTATPLAAARPGEGVFSVPA